MPPFFPDESVCARIASEHDLPVFLTSESHLRQQAREALDFPHAYGLTVRYAMKTNPNRNILRIFESMGIAIDASSEYEARRAMAAGIAADRVQLTAQEFPRDLASLIRAGVRYNATSLGQLERYGEMFPGTSVGIRLNPGIGSGSTARTNVGGPASSFGIWHEQIARAKDIATKHGLRIVRIHTHIGSGADSAIWVRVASMSLAMLEHFPEADTLDLGGGFKVARMPDEISADMREIGSAVREEFMKFEAATGRRIALEIEPGTFLAANSTCLLARVEEVVDTGSEGYAFVKTNTGMTEITRPSLYGAQHPIRVLTTPDSPVRPLVVVGHCCESGDILTPAKGDPEGILPRELPVPRSGDIILVGGAGSYCSGMSTKHYNSFPEAGELLLREDGNIAVMRERQSPEQIWANERDVAL